jgi:hypothetical protein
MTPPASPSRRRAALRGTLAMAALIAGLNATAPAYAQLFCAEIEGMTESQLLDVLGGAAKAHLRNNAFFNVLTEGHGKLPYVDAATAGLIAVELAREDYAQAAYIAVDWSAKQGVKMAFGATGSAILSAIKITRWLGVTLARGAHRTYNAPLFDEFYEELRAQREIRDHDWPESFSEFARRYSL